MTASEDKFTRQTLLEVWPWTDTLFSLRCTRPLEFRFRAGQFARLGLCKADGGTVWRAYSMVSAPADDYLEFFSVVVPGGDFTSELCRLGPGDALLVERQPYGFLTLDRFPDGRDLWLLATGTGLGPFLSILREPEVWQRFERILLVHSVRTQGELAYRGQIGELPARMQPPGGRARLQYLPLVTREAVPGTLHGRITTLLDNGELEHAAGLALDPAYSRLMLCGNPQMIKDCRELLKARGLQLSLSRKPGQVAVENYW
ncbi:ferredoxin--NADP reductase [Azorhizophilus paspali]|uniref:ferredoxin--NADP(+) reductase n=1 Tax=Azorhizophilus paspali TaxID=69963 RepID=A0ABV6SS37_AZOPA